MSRNGWKGLLAVLAAAVLGMAPGTAAAQAVEDWQLLTPPPAEGPVKVHAAFHLLDVNGIDDENETFEFTGILSLKWTDPRLAFDPAAAGAKEKVYTGAFQFDEASPGWYPEVVLLNAAGLYETRGTVLRQEPDGSCHLVQMIHAAAETKLDLHRYPYDRQRLEAVFKVLGFGVDEVVLAEDPDLPNDHNGSIRIPQWKFNGMAAGSRIVEVPYGQGTVETSQFTLALDVQRERGFIVRLLVIPLLIIVFLSWSVFWMDRSSLGDRMSVSFVGILASVTYQIVIGDILPPISYYTPIHAFTNFSFWIMCLTVVVNLAVGTCDKAGRPELGNRIDRHCRWGFPLAYAATLALIVASGIWR
jgi:hypothetical protein